MANTNFTFFLDNVIGRDFVAVKGIRQDFVPSLYSSEMPGSRLKTQEPTEVARILTLSPSSCGWSFHYYDLPFPTDAFGIVHSSLSKYGKWRVVGVNNGETSPIAMFTDFAANSVLSQTNSSGGSSEINKPLHTPNDLGVIEPVDIDAGWSVSLSVPISDVVSDSTFCVVLYCAIYDSTLATIEGNVIEYPKVAARLFEDGNLIANLGYKACTSEYGQYIFFEFEGNLISNLLDVEIELTFSIGIGASGSSVLYTKLWTFGICAENGLPEFDTGWQDNIQKGWLESSDQALFPSNIGILLETTWTAKWLALYYRDDGLELNPLKTIFPLEDHEFPGIPSGLVTPPNDYIDTGVFVSSKALRLRYGIPRGKEFVTMNPVSIETQQAGLQGESYSADSFKIRDGKSFDLLVTHSEGQILHHRIGLARGTQGAFMVSMDPNLPQSNQPFLTEWVTCQEMSGLQRMPQRYNPSPASPNQEMLYYLTLRLKERL